MTPLSFRNKQGELIDIQAVPATRFKNELGAILDQAVRSGAVAITRHDTTRAVLLSIEEFESLAGARSQSLDAIGAQFDGLLARMQTPKAKRGMKAAFNSPESALGRTAVKAARK